MKDEHPFIYVSKTNDSLRFLYPLCHSNEKPRGNVISNIKVYSFKSLFKYQSVNARGYTYLTMKCEA